MSDVLTVLKNEPGRYFSVQEIEVYSGLCRCVVRKRLARLVADSRVDVRHIDQRVEYRLKSH